MNYLKISKPIKTGMQFALVLMIAMAAMGTSMAQASGSCVHPTGAWGCFKSVQAAVDAADSGDWISIRAGKYVEQVSIIGKDLTLIGKPGAVIQAPVNMEDTLSPFAGTEARPIILVNDADVTIRSLVIDGANSGTTNFALQGITFINANGTIQGNVIKNTGFGTPTLPIVNGEPSYQGEGVVVVNFAPTPKTVNVIGNWISNYNTVGLTVFAEADPNDPTFQNLTVNVIGNTIIGSGPTDVIDQWGMFFGGYNFADPQYSITGTIKGNRIKNQVSVAPYPLPGIGILTLNTSNVEISGNVIENTGVGLIANQASGAQIVRNQITGPTQDPTGSSGLLLSGNGSYVYSNRFKNLELGILLFTEDPDFGTAYNTALDDNRFDRVALDAMTVQGLFSTTSTADAKTKPASKWNVWKRLPIH